MKKLWILGLLALQACNVFEVHPYSGRITGPENINNRNIQKIEENTKGKDTLTYIFLSDSQRWYDELESAVKHINTFEKVDFVIHGGDLTDFGLTKEFLWQRDILEGLDVPYVVLIGNHDCLANGEEVFEQVFGPTNFSFMAGDTKFQCLNTNALENDYNRPIPDFEFIRSERDKGNYKKMVVSMHAKPTSEQFNNNVSNIFQSEMNKFSGFLYANYGHEHQYLVNDLFNDGKIYYGVPNVGKRQYLKFTITPTDYTHELVTF